MALDDVLFPDALIGHEAVDWLHSRRRFAGELLDRGLTVLGESFGNSRSVSAFVPSLGPPGIRRDFFLAIDGEVESDHDWERLVTAYQRFDERSAAVSDSPTFLRERSFFDLVLWRQPPSAVPWDEVGDRWFRAP
jgi:hypothetical protein